MRFFASWWERISVRMATRSTVAVVVAAGLLAHLPSVVSRVLGNYWN